MTQYFLILITVFNTFIYSEQSEAKSGLYKQHIKTIGRKSMDLNTYKGHPLLIVNIATQCGYTPQLEGLEKLYKEYKDKGLVVLGVPSNDFGSQTPEDNEGVKKFCKLNYGVTFPLTEKVVVKGEKKHPLISELLKQSKDHKEIAWNFEKFLVDKQGQLVERYASDVKPNDPALKDKINSLL